MARVARLRPRFVLDYGTRIRRFTQVTPFVAASTPFAPAELDQLLDELMDTRDDEDFDILTEVLIDYFLDEEEPDGIRRGVIAVPEDPKLHRGVDKGLDLDWFEAVAPGVLRLTSEGIGAVEDLLRDIDEYS